MIMVVTTLSIPSCGDVRSSLLASLLAIPRMSHVMSGGAGRHAFVWLRAFSSPA